MDNNKIILHFDVDGEDFSKAGEVSSSIKKTLKQLGIAPAVIRKVAIAMYEGEINMVIHANGGAIDVEISPEEVKFILNDRGPGIPNIPLAMTEGYSTANEDIRTLGFGAGMGLPNMKNYTDSFNITSVVGVGTKVEMTVKIN